MLWNKAKTYNKADCINKEQSWLRAYIFLMLLVKWSIWMYVYRIRESILQRKKRFQLEIRNN